MGLPPKLQQCMEQLPCNKSKKKVTDRDHVFGVPFTKDVFLVFKKKEGMMTKVLPRGALFLWRMRLVLFCIVPAFIGGFFYYVLPGAFTLFSFIWVGGYLFCCFVYLPLRYSQYGYSISEKMVKVEQGVFFFRMDAVYIKNIQYTSISQTPLQKVLRLASLHIFAAGSCVHLPSLPHADARLLRIQLLKKMESFQHD